METIALTEYPFREHDGGRATSKRPRQKNDCTVRALALVTGLDYDTAYDLLAAAGRKSGGRFRLREWAEAERPAGCRLVWHSFPAVKGERRMNLVAFTRRFQRGKFIVKTAKHVFAVLEGVVYDTEPEGAARCIYGCWQVLD